MSNNYPAIKPSLNLDMVNGIYVDPRITFTRAGTRTYFGREWVKAEENLLSNSNDFSNTTYWTLAATTQAAVADPSSGTNATRLTATAGNATHGIDSRNVDNNKVDFLLGTRYVMAIRAKKATHNFIQIVQAGITGAHANFNLDTGVVGSALNTVSTSITEYPVGSGWYTCIAITDSILAVTTGGLTVCLVASSTSTRREAFNAAGTETVDVFQSKIEQRAFAAAYIPTTTQPITRYQRKLQTAAANEWPREYDPVTGECLGRSVWAAATNLLLRSQEFENAYWTKSGATISPNVLIAPDGTLTADKLVESAANSTHLLQRSIGLSSAAHTSSIFAKKGERNWVYLRGVGAGSVNIRAWFNLDTGTKGTVETGATSKMTDMGNGWYLCELNIASATASSFEYQYAMTTGDTVTTHAGDGVSGIFIWQAQLEASSRATPAIPTVASQVTRIRDNPQMTGANFSSWFNAPEGTLVVESKSYGDLNVGPITFEIGDGTVNNRIFSGQFISAAVRSLAVQAGNVPQVVLANSADPSGYVKSAGSYKFNDFVGSVNGGAALTDTSGLVPTVNRASIGSNTSGVNQILQGVIKSIRYYPQAFTAAQVEALSL